MIQGSRATWSPLLAVISLCALTITLACAKLPRRYALVPAGSHQNSHLAADQKAPAAPLVNINTAPAGELEKLPGIGRGLAARIIAHREQYGRFRRAEHVIMVRGIGDRRFRKMGRYITVE
jgi:competence ComEA-like helix-hairpin-helix protein